MIDEFAVDIAFLAIMQLKLDKKTPFSDLAKSAAEALEPLTPDEAMIVTTCANSAVEVITATVQLTLDDYAVATRNAEAIIRAAQA